MKTIVILILILTIGCAPFITSTDLVNNGEPTKLLTLLFNDVINCAGVTKSIPMFIFVNYPVLCNGEIKQGCYYTSGITYINIKHVNKTNGAIISHEIIHHINPLIEHDDFLFRKCENITFTK